MKLLSCLPFLLLGLVACSSEKPEARRHVGATNEVVITPATGDGSTKKDDGKYTSDVDETPLNQFALTGSSMRLMDARALTVLYRHVFKTESYGFAHCLTSKPRDPSDCTDSIFTSAERPSMGSFDLNTQRLGRGPINVNPAENLTLNYTRTLRAALVRECDPLVVRELAALKAGTIAANVLIKSEIPTVESIDAFMKRLFGTEGSEIAIDVSASQYVAAFTGILQPLKDPQRATALRNSYTALCMALTMDPQVFLY